MGSCRSRTMRAHDSKLPRMLGTLIYVFVLHYTYVEFMAPTFGYLGFRARPQIDWFGYGVTIGSAALMSTMLPSVIRRPSDFLLWSTFVLSVAPSMTAAFYTDIVSASEAIKLALAVGASFTSAVILARGGPRFTARLRVHNHLAGAIVIGFSLLTYGYLATTTGLQIRLVALTGVRDLRFEYRASVASAGIIGYLLPMQAYVVNPLIMARGLYRGRPSVFFTGVLGQVLLYSVAGHKMAILSPAVVLLIALAYRVHPRLPGAAILYGVMGVALLSLGLDKFVTGGDLTLIFVQRLLLVPAGLVAAFVDVFGELEKAAWGYSFLAPFVDYPYTVTPNYLVGAWFSGDASISANANFFADGFANYGYVGMAIETFVFVVILWLLDATLRHLPMPIVVSMLVLPALALANVSAFTVILSQGIGLVMLLGLVLPRNGWGRCASSRGKPVPEKSVVPSARAPS